MAHLRIATLGDSVILLVPLCSRFLLFNSNADLRLLHRPFILPREVLAFIADEDERPEKAEVAEHENHEPIGGANQRGSIDCRQQPVDQIERPALLSQNRQGLVDQQSSKMRGIFWLRAVCSLTTLSVTTIHAFVPDRPALRSTALFAKTKVKPVPTRSNLTPAQRLMRKNGVKKNQDESAPFDKVKEAVYLVGDGLDKITKPKTQTDKVYDGYKGDSKKGQTPTQKLLQSTLQRRATNPSPGRKVKDSSNTKPSIFDSVKETFYGTADLVSKPKKSSKAKPPLQRISVPSEEFKPVARERQVPDSVRDALPDLESNNPLKRTAAEVKIRNAEIKEKARKTQQGVEDGIKAVKEGAYQTKEFVQSTAKEIEQLPDRIRNFAAASESFFREIPVVVKETIDIITAIPVAVEQKAAQTKKSVEETVDKTVKVVDDVKAIPSKVKQSAEKTAQTAKDTVDKTVQVVNDVKAIPSKVQQTTQNTVKTVEDITFNTKVLLRMEKPKPPPPPPPPKDAGELARRVGGSLAKGTGQAAWWVTKGAAGLGWKAVVAGVDKAKEAITQKQQQSTTGEPSSPPPPQKRPTVNAKAAAVAPPPTMPTTISTPPKPAVTTKTAPAPKKSPVVSASDKVLAKKPFAPPAPNLTTKNSIPKSQRRWRPPEQRWKRRLRHPPPARESTTKMTKPSPKTKSKNSIETTRTSRR